MLLGKINIMILEDLRKLDILSRGNRYRHKFKYHIFNIIMRILYIPYNIIIGSIIYIWIKYIRKKKKSGKKIGLAIVAIAKNESEYIQEWIEYHRIIGVQKIFLYDNDSTDDTYSIIEPYIKSGFITYNKIHGTNKQFTAYNKALWDYGCLCKYMAYIDCDEFICPIEYKANIINILDKIFEKKSNAGGVLINWCMFGSSNFTTKPQGLLIENFIYRANIGKPGTNVTKSIIKPERVLMWDHPHFPVYDFPFIGIDIKGNINNSFWNDINNYELLKINHYFTKSKEQWIKRRSIGKADLGPNDKRSIEEFYKHDNNDIIDFDAARYKDEIILQLQKANK